MLLRRATCSKKNAALPRRTGFGSNELDVDAYLNNLWTLLPTRLVAFLADFPALPAVFSTELPALRPASATDLPVLRAKRPRVRIHNSPGTCCASHFDPCHPRRTCFTHTSSPQSRQGRVFFGGLETEALFTNPIYKPAKLLGQDVGTSEVATASSVAAGSSRAGAGGSVDDAGRDRPAEAGTTINHGFTVALDCRKR